jgi:glycosyltransferase involved in cell wall biosynthesis
VDDARLDARWLWANRRTVAYLHLHWAEPFYRYLRGPLPLRKAVSAVRLAVFVFRLGFARLLGYRIVWTVHQLTPHERESPLIERLGAAALARAAVVLLVHDAATAAAVCAEIPSAAAKVRVVPHGSYIGVYPPGRRRTEVRAELAIPDDAFVLLAFGELRGYKNVGLLLDAFRGLSSPGARLVVAGNPKDPSVADAVAAAAAADGRIIPLLRWIGESEVAELFGASDAVVLTRSDGGTSGSLVLAMSLGVQVVAADRPGYRDLLGDDAGVFFAPDDPSSLRAALAEVSADEAGAAERGRAALARAEALSWRGIAERVAALLRET